MEVVAEGRGGEVAEGGRQMKQRGRDGGWEGGRGERGVTGEKNEHRRRKSSGTDFSPD